MSIRNEMKDTEMAWFCADKNIYLKNSKGDETFMIEKSEGIPVCPDSHKFKKEGEILYFKLIFPKLPETIKGLDLIENCSDNCFSFYGIILDPVLTKEINLFEKGVALYSSEKKSEALSCFIEIIKTTKDKNSNIYAYSMYIIPLIYIELEDKVSAKKEYRNLKKSEIKDKDYFIEKLKENEFFSKLK